MRVPNQDRDRDEADTNEGEIGGKPTSMMRQTRQLREDVDAMRMWVDERGR
jgi:hypothetical protein